MVVGSVLCREERLTARNARVINGRESEFYEVIFIHGCDIVANGDALLTVL